MIEAGVFRAVLLFARLAPRQLLLLLGSAVGRLGHVLDGRHRRIGLDNLAQAMPQLSPRRRRRIVQRCWRHFGRITFDAFYFPRLGADAVGRVVHYQGLEHVRAAYAGGNGVLLFTGHFGHWELIGLMQGFIGLPLALVARPLDNPYLERLLHDLRCHSGNRVIHKRRAVRGIVGALREGLGVAIVIDQDARADGVFVPFFGRPASTTSTLANLALRCKVPIIPAYALPRPDGSYLCVYEPAIAVEDTGDREADVLRTTADCTARIESWVRANPEFWLWMHQRWKTRPAAEGAGED